MRDALEMRIRGCRAKQEVLGIIEVYGELGGIIYK